MRFAILGAGFCGLAVAWQLLHRGDCEVTLYDPLPIGKGTSGIAAGMLHPYVGAHAKLNWRSREGLAATQALLEIAQLESSDPLIIGRGLLRLALTEKQLSDFARCAKQHDDVRWLTATECQTIAPDILPFPGIMIDSALAIDCEKYLQGLWLACKKLGATFQQQAIHSLATLDKEELIIAALGATTNSLPELAHIQLKSIKGQILELAWPKELAIPKMAITSQTYLLADQQQKRCIAGATFEKQFTSPAADIETAKKEILTKTAAYLPAIANAQILGCRAGLRAVTPDRRPLIKRLDERCWILTGMGSKGLLYHALLAEELVDQILR